MAVASATRTLAAAGVASARAEAEQLAAYVLGTARGRLALADGFTAGQLDRFDALVRRRSAREPLQHLTGVAPFRYLELAVGPGVFVPRPETELLAGWGVEQARSAGAGPGRTPTTRPGSPPAAGPRWPPAGGPVGVDLCSGSGAIALSMAHEIPGVRVVAVERSPAALPWLRRNAAARAAAGDPPIEVVEADVTDPGLLDELTGRVDVLLCNPPYVPQAVAVPEEVARHDPGEAVFGGPDGLAVIRPVIQRAGALLRPGGVFGIEHDDTHGTVVPDLLAADGRFTRIVGHRDLTGRPRFATAVRSGGADHGTAVTTWQTGSS